MGLVPRLNISSLLQNNLHWNVETSPELARNQVDISDILHDSLIFSPREFSSEACRSQTERVAVRTKGPALPDFLTLPEKQEIQKETQVFMEFLLIVSTGS